MNETTENFFKVLSEWQDTAQPQMLFYRLYHDQLGQPVCYSMEDLPGKYVDIDQSTYAASPYARVINGKLTVIKPAGNIAKLVPSMVGTSCDARDVCVIANTKETVKWSLKRNETD